MCTAMSCSLASIEEEVDAESAMLYGDVVFHSWQSGEEMLKL